MKAVAYARYSSDNQRQESITAQLRAIHAYAARESIKITSEYIDEARSATTDERPDFQRMISELDVTQPDIILVHKLDRFARDRIDSGYYRWVLKKRKIRIVAVEQDFGDGPEAALMEAVVEGFAEYFSRNLSKETKKGLYETVIQGKHCGGIPPLGYDVGPDGKYIINEHEASAVKLIFAMKVEGKSYSAIIQALNESGYRTKKGGVFGKNSLHDILRNEKYIGIYVYRKTSKHSSRTPEDPLAVIRLDDAVPRIIDDETFYKVQDLMDGRKTQGRSRTDTVYILTGLAKCGVCGQAMVGSSEYHNNNQHFYYRCNNAKRTAGTACNNTRRYKKDELEQKVVQQVSQAVELLSSDIDRASEVIYQEVNNRLESHNLERQELRHELQNIQQQLDNLVASIAAGVDAKVIAPQVNELGKKKEALERQIRRASGTEGISKELIKEEMKKRTTLSLDLNEPIKCRDSLQSFLDAVIVLENSAKLVPRGYSG